MNCLKHKTYHVDQHEGCHECNFEERNTKQSTASEINISEIIRNHRESDFYDKFTLEFVLKPVLIPKV